MDLFAHSRSHRRSQARNRRSLERLYGLVESVGQAAAARDGQAPDSLQAQFPGYVRDRRAEAWHRRPCAWLTLGGMGFGVIGGITIAVGVNSSPRGPRGRNVFPS